jgi:beta-lactamase class A
MIDSMRMTAIPMLLLAASAASQPLEESLHARIADFPGAVSLYAKNLDSGATAGIRESGPVRTASTIKLAILLAVFDAVARGNAKWTEPLTVAAAEKVSGTGVLGSEVSDGVQLPLRDVAHLMIVLSDNTATNMILETTGGNVARLGVLRLLREKMAVCRNLAGEYCASWFLHVRQRAR